MIGYDHRAGVEREPPSRSDTVMLIRADPATKTISLLSFPRDLDVPIYCTRERRPVTDRPDQLRVLALRLEGDAPDGRAS